MVTAMALALAITMALAMAMAMARAMDITMAMFAAHFVYLLVVRRHVHGYGHGYGRVDVRTVPNHKMSSKGRTDLKLGHEKHNITRNLILTSQSVQLLKNLAKTSKN